MVPLHLPPLEPDPGPKPRFFIGAKRLGMLATVSYIALMALIAGSTGFYVVLFPELGALSHDVLQRPHGTWARAPLMLVVTPCLTGVVGTLVARHLAYGAVSVLLTVGGSILIMRLLRSPIAPAISAGLLPVALGERSWWYPPSLLIGLALLAGISLVWRRIVSPPPAARSDLVDDIVEETPDDYFWIPFFLVFLIAAIMLVRFTGWRFLLFPPLVVIGFEMFAHAEICPWAGRPLVLSIACTLSATAGVLFVGLFGVGPLAAAFSIVFGIGVLRVFDLHVPPALAVGLLPFVIPHPNYQFPVAVAAGTLLLTVSFMVWRMIIVRAAPAR